MYRGLHGGVHLARRSSIKHPSPPSEDWSQVRHRRLWHVRFATFAGFREHCKVEHEGTEVAHHAPAKKAANTRRHTVTKRPKAIRGLCTVYLNCDNEAVVDAGGMLQHAKNTVSAT